MNTTIEYEGRNVEEALENASRSLKISKDKIQYDVISYGSTGIFGLVGVKKAKIRIKNEGSEKTRDKDKRFDALSLVNEAFASSEEKAEKKKSEGKTRTPAKNRFSKAPSEKNNFKQKAKSLSETKEGEEEKEIKEKTDTEPDAAPPKIQRPKARKKPQRTERRYPVQNKAEEVEKERPPSDEEDETERSRPVLEEIDQEIIDKGREIISRIINTISENNKIHEEVFAGRILYNIDSDSPALLIGKRGQTLEAIQYIADKMINRNLEGRVRIQLNVEGYLETRKEHLQQLAIKQAEKARRTGRPATIGQMNAHDRRIIHLALKDDKNVRTQSVGEGYYRRLVIFPKKMRRGPNENRKSNI